jgi:hypothetical protein
MFQVPSELADVTLAAQKLHEELYQARLRGVAHRELLRQSQAMDRKRSELTPRPAGY